MLLCHFKNNRVTNNTYITEVIVPPISGTVMGIITSAPVPVDQRMGTNPNRETETVINFGLSLLQSHQ
jgi:hypothetical protein